MAVVTPQDVGRTGLAPVYSTPTTTDTFANNGRCFVHVKNASGSPINVTVTPTRSVDGLTPAGRVVAVPATTGDRMIGPFLPEDFNNPDTGTMDVTYSSTTSVTAAIIRLPRA